MTSRWEAVAGPAGADRPRGAAYAARFETLAAGGADIHGEATLCHRWVFPGARILDAGCGTGRVAIRLTELGHHAVGVDLDADMLEVARGRAPHLRWVHADLAYLDLGERFDLVLAAGNVIPLVAPGTEQAVVSRLAAHTVPGGHLVAGFGLDAEHLPLPEPPVSLAAFDRWSAEQGLWRRARFSTWDADAWDGGGYAVTVLRRPCLSLPY